MFRFIFRLAAMVALSVSVIMAVVDAARSGAASALVLTPRNASSVAASPDSGSGFENLVRARVSPLLWDGVIAWVLGQPGFAVFAALAFLFYAIGYRRQRRRGEFAPT